MSNHGATASGTSLREYAAAEDRLLNFFSPLSAPEDGSAPPPTTDNVPVSASVAAANLDPSENVLEVDPSRDSMVAFISDDTDLHSLLSSSDSSFKGFDDSMQDNEKGAGGDQSLIFGAFRNEENLDYHLCSDNQSTPERVVLSPQLSNAPVASTSGNYILTNGIDSHEDKFEFEEQHVVIEASHTDCVIYDDSMVLLTDDQCCEIIVQTDQEMERAYLMGVEHHQQQQQQLLESPETLDNGVGYSGKHVEEMPRGEPHVYLSDAAMVLEQQQQQLLLDAADEETPQVSDSYVDDICEVYDDELEDHDDEHVIEVPHDNLQMQLQEEHEQGDTSILVVSDVEDRHHQKELPAVAEVPHSSTTEFPVSSTSMPNASDYDDYDADVGTAEEQSPPHPRKYNLLKNTLSAEAMDRRLAYICQSQPQMSVSEKLANWNCAHNCDAVEDVENFEAEFVQHESKPAVQLKFNEFYDKLRQSMTELKRDHMQRSASTDAPDTPYSSEDVAMQKRPNYRRLMQLQTEPQTDPIVLDDDDDDDDCIEVQVTPSVRTLVPDPEIQMTAPTTETVQEDDVIVKTMETQTISHSLQSKQTSTADLSQQMPPQSMQECIKLTPMMQDAMLYEVKLTELNANSEEQQQRHTEQEQGQHEVLGNSVEYHNDAQFYEQHEFCNYLGLTELATANAVANAMRELANSTVARRSLRVRTQQQLDRMRMDVRGKRRQREKHEQQEEQLDEQQDVQIQLEEKPVTSESNCSNSHSHCSSNRHRKSLTLTGNEITVMEMGSPHMSPPRISPATQTIEYYYHSPTGDVQHHPKSLLTVNEANALSLEAAFAKVYAAAAPAQSDLHECMQHRLRQARETKPSIYIVKSMNNSVPSNSTSAVCSTPVAPTPERLKSNKTPEPIKIPPNSARKSSKKTPQKCSTAMSTAKATKRRRTTGVGGVNAAAMATSDRDLITRSMNSKMLRNRKVNMLKTFELADTAHGRSKQRLSGGSTGNKRVVAKTVKNTAKKTVPGSPLHQLVESGQQHRVEQQQQQTPTKNTGTTRTPRTPNRTPTQFADPKAKKRKRFRAKSLPAAFNPEEQQRVAAGHGSAAPVTPQMSPKQQHHIAKPLTATREYLRNPALVSPPLYSAAVRRYVNAVRSPKEHVQQQHLNLNPTVEEKQHSQQPEGFFDLSGPYSRLAKPALTYPPLSPPPTQRAPHFSRRARQMAGSNVSPEVDKMPGIHMTPPGGLLSLTKGSTALENPLAGKNGKVLYMFYELEQLIVLQERVITFWKYSKIFNVLQKSKPDESSTNATASQQHTFNIFGAKTNTVGNKNARRKSGESESVEPEGIEQRWVYLGGTRRTTNDMEVSMPYANRICAHNSTPVYIEMRSHQLDHHRRESKLLSLYVNVYYYCDEELRPKMHSVHLDAVNCEWNQVIYTSITESRYFVMAWQQEIVMGKPRAGICKYSLTPTLDTLASIREFKQLRHELKHIECLTEDRLIGYGLTRITIWDHRSGDTLMNYDLGFKLGRNLGVMHFPSFEMDQSSLLVLYQHVKEQNQWPELRIIACELSHATPSHRLLHVHRLPSPQFDSQLVAVNTGDHLILKAPSDDEIWISISDPRQLTYLAPQGTQRFYTRLKSQVIIVTPETLTVDSIANHVLQLATQHQQMMMMAAAEVAASTG